MEEGRIPDDAITASSSYEMKSVGPQNARYEISLAAAIYSWNKLRSKKCRAVDSYVFEMHMGSGPNMMAIYLWPSCEKRGRDFRKNALSNLFLRAGARGIW